MKPTRRMKRRKVALPPLSHRWLRHYERVCLFIEAQPYRSVKVPFPADPPMTARLLKRMARYRLIHHREDCQWRLSVKWRDILQRLAEGAVDDEILLPSADDETPPPRVIVAGPDTMNVNLLGALLPPWLMHTCDAFKAAAQQVDKTIETPWLFYGIPLSMHKAGVGTGGEGGVSWGYILRNEMIEVKLRKRELGGIIGAVRLSSKCLWTNGAEGALDGMRQGVQALWDYQRPAERDVDYPGYQTSQLHLCADILHFQPRAEDLHRIVMRSIKKDIHIPSEDERVIPSYEDDDPYFDPWEEDDPYPDPPDMGDWGDDEDTNEDDDEADDEARSEDEETQLAEELGVKVHVWGKRASGISFSPGGDIMMVWYDKALEERRSLKKKWMIPIHQEKGWDGVSPLTRVEGRLRRPAFRDLRFAFGEDSRVWVDDPWETIKHFQDIWGYVVGLPPEADVPDVAYRGWLRLACSAEGENRGRWPTDPVWVVVQRAQFNNRPPVPLKRLREIVPDLDQIDAEIYGLLKTRSMLRGSYMSGSVTVTDELVAFDERIEQWMKRKGVNFADDVREKARMAGKPVPLRPSGTFLPRIS